jgi:hypothetical protein
VKAGKANPKLGVKQLPPPKTNLGKKKQFDQVVVVVVFK